MLFENALIYSVMFITTLIYSIFLALEINEKKKSWIWS